MGRFIIALIYTLSVCALPVCADERPAQDAQSEKRDGRWLRDGIREYRRLIEKVPDQTIGAASQGASTVYYIRGVLDVTHSMIVKATVQEVVINTAKSSPKYKSLSDELMGMHNADNLFAPLWNTDYYEARLQIDQCVQIISNYLDAHPEQWEKSADDLIELALLDKFPVKKN
jgi:hypothetical protein